MKIPKKTDKAPEAPKKKYVNPLHKGKIRNALCICGSGKKVKRCHGRDLAIGRVELNKINSMLSEIHNKANGVADEKENKHQPESGI